MVSFGLFNSGFDPVCGASAELFEFFSEFFELFDGRIVDGGAELFGGWLRIV
jgi:hypothetical protein